MIRIQNTTKTGRISGLFFFLLTSLLAPEISAQQTGEDELGAWYMYFGMNRISDAWSIHSEAQFRFYETTRTFNQLLLRPDL